jgi:hypothetical protein
MTDDTKIGLVVRRAKALLSEVHQRWDEHAEKVRQFKAGEGAYHGVGPTLEDFTAFRIALQDAIDQYEETTGHEHLPFTSEKVGGLGGGSETRERHESYGLVRLFRSHGGHGATHLFGSHVEYHPVTIRLEVRRAERTFDNHLSYDRYHAREPVLEAELSAAQFTDALTLMNHGEGIPCTLRYVGGVKMENVPEAHRSEQHKIVEGFREKMREVREAAAPFVEQIQAILGKKSIGKGDRKEIASLVERLVRDFTDNASFTLGQFNEAAEKLETEAKKEVEAFATSILVAAGIDHLKDHALAAAAGIVNTEALEEGDGG